MYYTSLCACNFQKEASVIRYRYNYWRTQLALPDVQVLALLHRETLLNRILIKVQKWFPSVRLLSSCFAFVICILHWHLGVTFWQQKNLGTKDLLWIWNASDHWRGSSLKKRQTWTRIRRLPDVVFSASNASFQFHPLHTCGSYCFLTCFVGWCWDII